MEAIDWIKEKYNDSLINKIIMINVAVFILTAIFGVEFLAIPLDGAELLRKPWTLFTHMFAHSGFFHILFNTVTLYFAGNMFLQYFSEKNLIQLYAVGGLLAAILTTILYTAIPSLGGGLAVGASAAIMAVLIALCVHRPNDIINLMFIGQVKLKYVALVILGIDLISIGGSNTGGHIAHLSGALIGIIWLYSYNKNKVNRIYRKGTRPQKTKKPPRQQKPKTNIKYDIDTILDKIGKNGYQNLSKNEKEYIDNYKY